MRDATIDIDANAHAAPAQERAERRHGEPVVATLDRAAGRERVRIHADAGCLEEKRLPDLTNVDGAVFMYVPNGRTPSTTFLPTRARAAWPTVPSPPATSTAS